MKDTHLDNKNNLLATLERMCDPVNTFDKKNFVEIEAARTHLELARRLEQLQIEEAKGLEKNLRSMEQGLQASRNMVKEFSNHTQLKEQVKSAETQIQDSYISLKHNIKLAEQAIHEHEKTATDQINTILEKNFSSLSAWDNEAWESWEPNGELSLPDCLRVGQNKIGAPIGISLFGKKLPNAIIIKGSAAKKDLAQQILGTLLLRIALSMPKVSKFTLIDPNHDRCFKMQCDLENLRAGETNESLSHICNDVKRIPTDVLGYANSFKDLEPKAWGVECFEYVFVADFLSINSSQEQKSLLDIAKRGAVSGRYLFMYVNTDQDLPRFLGSSDFNLDDFGAVSIDLNKTNQDIQFDELPTNEQQQNLLQRVKNQETKKEQTNIRDLVGANSNLEWSFSSKDCIETNVGEGLTVWFGSKGGRHCPHGALAGTTGSGKSNFLHMLITGLSLRYPPDELQFYLVDGKSGVGFQRYTSLPHAKVVSLRTAPLLALSVLRDMSDEMEIRFKQFANNSVDNISDFREKTNQAMPRLLLVADEYQNLFEADAQEASKLMLKIAEKGRAAGIHLFLASQNFIAKSMINSSNIFENIALRIALQLSDTPVNFFGKKGCKAIGELNQPGMVVINDNLGHEDSNTRGMTAGLGDKESKAIIEEIQNSAEQLGNQYTPVVLDGDDHAGNVENSHSIRCLADQRLSEVVSKDIREQGLGIHTWNEEQTPILAVIGRKYSVAGDLVFGLQRTRNENTLLLGGENKQMKEMLANMVITMVAAHTPEQIQIYIIDSNREENNGGKTWGNLKENMLDPLGYDTAFFKGEAEAALGISQLRQQIIDRKEASIGNISIIVMMNIDMDKNNHDESLRDVLSLLKDGAPLGIHTMLISQDYTHFQELLNKRALRMFNHKVLWQLSETDSRDIIGSKAASQLSTTAGDKAVLYNAPRKTEVFEPFSSTCNLSSILKQLKRK